MKTKYALYYSHLQAVTIIEVCDTMSSALKVLEMYLEHPRKPIGEFYIDKF